MLPSLFTRKRRARRKGDMPGKRRGEKKKRNPATPPSIPLNHILSRQPETDDHNHSREGGKKKGIRGKGGKRNQYSGKLFRFLPLSDGGGEKGEKKERKKKDTQLLRERIVLERGGEERGEKDLRENAVSFLSFMSGWGKVGEERKGGEGGRDRRRGT